MKDSKRTGSLLNQQEAEKTADRRVLIVDDDVDLADSLRDLLEAERYQVEVAYNAADANILADTFAPHVALIDIRLKIGPGNGLDLLADLKQGHPDLLCIVMTAYADTDTAIKALQSNAYDYLRKPLHVQELATTMGRCFERIELEQKNRQATEALREYADELAVALAHQEELDRLKDEFIQNVSHELRSPLALVRGYAEMLSEGRLGVLQPEQQDPVSTIARSSRMLSDLVEDIALILGAKARPLERVPVKLDELAGTAVQDFRMVADQAQLTLKTEIASDLPPVSGSLVYLRRVVDNLLNNAIKFSEAGGVVTVHVWQEGKQIALEVRDTGIGIPPDQTERIFERFYQVDGSASRRYGGMGLGLALVKEVVDLHGGEVSVTSKLGEGSSFTVTIPVWEE